MPYEATATWIYLFCLLFGLGFMFISGVFGAVFGHMGFGDADAGGLDLHADGFDVHTGDFDVHVDGVDVHPDAGAGATLGPASAPVVSTLMAGFGGVGLICTKGFHLPPIISAPVSFAVAVGAATAVFYALSKLLMAIQGTSHGTLAELVGIEAQVITPIPADSLGEVAYTHAGVRESRIARSEEGVLIPRHSMVRITRVAGASLVVRELVDEQLRRLEEPEEDEPGEPEK